MNLIPEIYCPSKINQPPQWQLQLEIETCEWQLGYFVSTKETTAPRKMCQHSSSGTYNIL